MLTRALIKNLLQDPKHTNSTRSDKPGLFIVADGKVEAASDEEREQYSGDMELNSERSSSNRRNSRSFENCHPETMFILEPAELSLWEINRREPDDESL